MKKQQKRFSDFVLENNSKKQKQKQKPICQTGSQVSSRGSNEPNILRAVII
jgi:hypothetical protein